MGVIVVKRPFQCGNARRAARRDLSQQFGRLRLFSIRMIIPKKIYQALFDRTGMLPGTGQRPGCLPADAGIRIAQPACQRFQSWDIIQPGFDQPLESQAAHLRVGILQKLQQRRFRGGIARIDPAQPFQRPDAQLRIPSFQQLPENLGRLRVGCADIQQQFQCIGLPGFIA